MQLNQFGYACICICICFSCILHLYLFVLLYFLLSSRVGLGLELCRRVKIKSALIHVI